MISRHAFTAWRLIALINTMRLCHGCAVIRASKKSRLSRTEIMCGGSSRRGDLAIAALANYFLNSARDNCCLLPVPALRKWVYFQKVFVILGGAPTGQ
jgi:hypothetical protein